MADHPEHLLCQCATIIWPTRWYRVRQLMSAPHAERSPLGLPVFRSIWTAILLSNLGGMIQLVGASWMMTSLSDSPQLVALVQAATAFPIMLLSLVAGAVADNVDRRLVMLWAQSAMLLLSIGLAACTWMGWMTPGLLLAFTFLIASGTAFNNPAWQASVGDMVPRSLLPGAVSLNAISFNIARTVGPAVGGLIVAAAGAASAFLVNSLSYIGLIVVLARWRPDRAPNPLPRERLGVAMGTGVRYVALSSNINVVLLRSAIFGSAASAVPALMPVVARDMMASGSLAYAALLTSFGIGAVVGAIINGQLKRYLSSEWIVRFSALAVAIGAMVVGTTGALAVALPALMLAGMGWVLAFSTFSVTVQLAAPRWVVARALALYQMALFGGTAVGSWGFGFVAENHSVATALMAAATWQALGILITLKARLPDVERLDLNPLDH